MTAAPAPLRRGACPGLSDPMPTGDGLLARLMPSGTVSLEALSGLCAAAASHGNGIIEITSRGSIQARGLHNATAFAKAVAQLGIAAHHGIPIICGPLTGLDPDELIDASALVAELRVALATKLFATQLSPKVSIALDGGGALHLDALAADIRLRALNTSDGPRLVAALGGDAATARAFSIVALGDAIATITRLLEELAALGPQARGRDLGACRGTIDSPPPRPPVEPIGHHRLRDGTAALGVGFAFGHADAATLSNLVGAAIEAGAVGVRTAPGRALLIIGIATDRVAALVEAARGLGFIVAPDDPRRRVVACAGAPICAAAEIPARAIAPMIAASAAPLMGSDEVIHISGCAKRCAHHGAAALTAIGRAGACDLLIDDRPAGSVAPAALPRRLAELAATRSARHG